MLIWIFYHNRLKVFLNNAQVAVNGRTNLDVTLTPDAEALENAVVVGYGSAKKVGNLVGSVTTVTSDIVKNAPSASALDNLQGQVAGLSVMTTGGVAGDNATSMQLHGMGSLGSSTTPLYVIDGVPSSSYSIQMMNPNDILSISVLKDASSTSIYGARAANGVVFITTKSGSYNSNARVTVRSQYGISTLANMQFYENLMSGDELKDLWIRTGKFTPE
ncbi:MAG: TonB-dependent receptor plug domain-containing protein, partial [Prevotella sp.]|nr:TonB-dependent receptor plug domain-containing protein [Prevotella sp.]